MLVKDHGTNNQGSYDYINKRTHEKVFSPFSDALKGCSVWKKNKKKEYRQRNEKYESDYIERSDNKTTGKSYLVTGKAFHMESQGLTSWGRFK